MYEEIDSRDPIVSEVSRLLIKLLSLSQYKEYSFYMLAKRYSDSSNFLIHTSYSNYFNHSLTFSKHPYNISILCSDLFKNKNIKYSEFDQLCRFLEYIDVSWKDLSLILQMELIRRL